MSEPDISTNVYKHEKAIVKDDTNGLEPTATKGEADIGELEETRNGQFHRSFSPRQVHVRIQWRILDNLCLNVSHHLGRSFL